MTASMVREDAALESLVARVADEFVTRLKQGERPDVEEYAARHPDHAGVLREVLAALWLVERSAEGAGATASLGDDALPGCLGDFRILREVGRGGMGIVYEAEQRSLGRRVALKVLPFAATMDPRNLQRFQNEARAAASLHHEHIVPVFAVGQERGVHYYAMQFIDGQTLAAFLKDQGQAAVADQPTTPERHPHPVAETVAAATTSVPPPSDASYFRRVAEWGIAAAEALEHAHSLGIVHRDIKPGNLMLDESGKLWVTDFGLARTPADSGLTVTGDVVGTLRYMSPEQALAKHGLMDHRTDVYSLGVTLYELLTLRPAVAGDGRQEILRKVVEEESPSLVSLNRALPRDLETVVLKAMAKNPSERYASAKELVDDLKCWLADRAVKARRPSLAQRLGRLARRHKILVWSVGAAIGAIMLILALSAGYIVRDRQSRQVEMALRAEAALDETERLYRQGRWPEAREAARRTKQMLPSDEAGRPGERVHQWLVDLDLVERLAETRLRSGDAGGAAAADRWKAEEYQHAFREYGLEVWEGNAAEAAQQIRRSAVRDELVAALDDWALSQYGTRKEDGERWKRLLAIVRVADPDDLRNQVRDAIEKRDGPTFQKLAADHGSGRLPLTTRLLLAYGLEYAGCGKEATAQFQQAHQQAPGDFWVNYGLAYTYSNATPPRNEDAARHYTAALALRPGSARVRVNLAAVLIRAGRHDEAVRYCLEAIEIQPSLVEAHYNLGLCHAGKGRHDAAIDAFQEAIRLPPDSVAVHVNLGRALRDSGRFDAAIASCNRAISLDPNYAAAYEAVGVAFLRAGKLDKAISALATFIQKSGSDNPITASAHNNLAVALRDSKMFDQAIATFRKATRLNPALDGPRPNLVPLLVQQGKLDEAIEVLEEDVRHKPDRVTSHFNLGTALADKGRREEATAVYRRAIPVFEQALKVKPYDPELLRGLAHLLTTIDDPRLRDTRRASELAGRAVNLNPKDAVCWLTRGIAHYRSGEWKEAEETLSQAIELHDPKPLTPEMILYYAMALWRTGSQADARESYQVAAEMLDKMKSPSDQLVRLRAEAAALLGVKEPSVMDK